jgi:hypothetical protein
VTYGFRPTPSTFPIQLQRGIRVASQIPGLIQSDTTGLNDQKIVVLGTLGPKQRTTKAAIVAARTHKEPLNVMIILNFEISLFIGVPQAMLDIQ